MKTDPYASGVLDKTVHARMVADLEGVAAAANIQPYWIWTPLAETCAPIEVEWVKRFRFHAGERIAGLCYVGPDPDPEIETRMAAIAGALTRNFICARVMTVNELLAVAQDGGAPDMSCLLVPNFFVEKTRGPGTAQWRVSALLDVLIYRQAQGLQTVLYASDLEALALRDTARPSNAT